MDKEQVINQVINLIEKGNLQLLQEIVEEWAHGNSYRSAFEVILEPALREIGERWLKVDSNVSLAQGYVAAKAVECIMDKLELPEHEIATRKGPIVIGNIEDDYHALGRKLVITFLKAGGFEVIDLGMDILAEEFVDQAVLHQAPIIGVSAMMYSTAINIKKVRTEIDKRGLKDKIKLVVGGAIFKLRPELVSEFGGDATATSALYAGEVMDTVLSTMNGGKKS